MRILAISRNDAAAFYRLQAPFSILARCTKHSFDYARPGAVASAGGYGVLWMNQPASCEEELLARQFKAAGGRVVVDVDDWLFELPPSWSCYSDYYDRATLLPTARMRHYGEILEIADVVTCTTGSLAIALHDKLGSGRDIRLLPNCVLRGAVDCVPLAHHQLDGPLVGWHGTDNYWDDWVEIAPSVDEALEEVGGHLMLVGAPALVACLPRRLAARTHVYPLFPINRFESVHKLIGACDVALAWCTDRLVANTLRSPVKALQYGAAGVYTVASNTVYGAVITSVGSPMCVDQESLMDALAVACEMDDAIRRSRAKAWRDEIWQHYTYEENADLWREVIESA